jgi:sarcosine oxidase
VYDAIVVGVGGMGGATLLEFARRGLRVVGLDQFAVNHDQGSSHGETRIIRKAYFEHPDYVPLVTLAEKRWAEIEAGWSGSGQSGLGRVLVQRTGLLLGGPRDGGIISGARRAGVAHGLSFEDISASDLPERFPGFALDDEMSLLFEPDAGILLVDDCVRACVDQAKGLGAELHEGVIVTGWSGDESGVVVETDSGRYSAGSLVFCAGAWTGKLLADLNIPLEVQRRVVLWFESSGGAYGVSDGSPVFGFEVGEHFFYGFPSLDGKSVKVSEHFRSDTAADVAAVRRSVSEDDTRHIRAFAKVHLPGLTDRVVKDSVCLYTMTPDEHFILDRHPQHPNVAIAAGFSGHGFKFAPVVGAVLADFVCDGRTNAPVAFMGLSRFR